MSLEHLGYLHACHRCRRRDGGTCSADGRDITDHSAAGRCPWGFFPGLPAGELPPRGYGDVLARWLDALFVGRLWKRFVADTAPCRWPFAPDGVGVARLTDCGCSGRQTRLNARFPL